MSKRLDVVMAHTDKNGKKRYTKVGVAFVNDKGTSIIINPGVSISTPEGVFCNLYEPKERDDNANGFGGNDGSSPF